MCKMLIINLVKRWFELHFNFNNVYKIMNLFQNKHLEFQFLLFESLIFRFKKLNIVFLLNDENRRFLLQCELRIILMNMLRNYQYSNSHHFLFHL